MFNATSYLCLQRAVWPHHCWQASQLPARCLTQGHRMASAATSIPASWSLQTKRGRGARQCEDIWLKQWIAIPESSSSQKNTGAQRRMSYMSFIWQPCIKLPLKHCKQSCRYPKAQKPWQVSENWQLKTIPFYLEAFTPFCGEQVIDWSLKRLLHEFLYFPISSFCCPWFSYCVLVL